MLKSKIAQLLFVSSTLLSVNAFAEEEVKSEGPDLQDLNFYSTVELYVSNDKNADKIFSNYFKQFNGQVKKIKKEMSDYKKSIQSTINKSILETKSFIQEDQTMFDTNCKKELMESEIAQCSKIEKSLYEMKEGVKSMESELMNRTKKIEVDQINRLASLYTNYINKVNKLKVDVKNAAIK